MVGAAFTLARGNVAQAGGVGSVGLFDDVTSGHSSTSDPISENAELQMGEQYRLRLTLAGPYSGDMQSKISNLVKYGAGLNNELASKHVLLHSIVRIDGVRVGKPDASKALYKWDVFPVDIVFTKTGEGTPLLLVVGILVALVLAAVGLFFIVTNRQTFHEVRSTLSDDLPKLAGSLVAPALAVALVVYFMRR